MTFRGTKSTSWGSVASWYSEHLEGEDTYHTQVILPHLLRMFGGYTGARTVLEIGCGEGFFARALAAKGYTVAASDISPELIAKAQQRGGSLVHWFVANAEKLTSIQAASQDVVLAVLTLQNMRNLAAVFREVARVTKPGGRFVFVLNHPAFRIPKYSSWDYDGKANVQYRRVDAYLSEFEVGIDMQPGKVHNKRHEHTVSFHRPLSTFVNFLSKNGFAVTRLDELISHKHSVGARAVAENRSRREFPLFMVVEATKCS